MGAPVHSPEAVTLGQKIGLSCAAGMAVVLVVTGLALDEKPRSSVASSARPAKDLEALLLETRRRWNPALRAAFVQGQAARVEALATELSDVLLDREHGFLEEAIYLASAVRIVELGPALFRLVETGPDALRSPALRAAERLRPLTDPEVDQYLHHQHTAVVLAALGIITDREMPSLDRVVIELLGHRDGEVRDAALRALPDHLAAAHVRALMLHARSRDAALSEVSLVALGRASASPEVAAFLLDRLDDAGPRNRQAALRGLCARTQPLSEPGRLWSFALDDAPGLIERALAIACLERTESYRGVVNRGDARRLSPVLRYFVARCLLAQGDKHGAEILIEIATTSERTLSGVGPQLSSFITGDCRKILGRLSRTGASGDPQAWRRWYDTLRGLEPQTLPCVGLDLLASPESED